jgi:hypothetical protein
VSQLAYRRLVVEAIAPLAGALHEDCEVGVLAIRFDSWCASRASRFIRFGDPGRRVATARDPRVPDYPGRARVSLSVPAVAIASGAKE